MIPKLSDIMKGVNMIPISEQTAKFIDVLETEGDIESKLRRFLEREFLRRLTGYRLTDRLLSQKYGMDYDALKSST